MQYRFGVITEPFKAEVHTAELRELKPDEVLIDMEACNICTGDYQQFIGLRNHQGFPHAGGHEWVGRILEKGEDVIDDYKIGDRVTALNGAPCGQCYECKMGRFAECRHNVPYVQQPDGYFGDKLFATKAIVKASALVRVTDDVDFPEAAMMEPLSTTVFAARQGNIKPLDDVVVVGCGTMGILNALTAKAFGARVFCTDLMPVKLERARSMGFAHVIDVSQEDPVEVVKKATNGKGADAVYVCVANTAAYKQAYSLLKEYRGRIIFFPAGYPKPEFQIDPNEIHYRLITLVGAFGATNQDFLDAADFVAKGLIDPSWAMEHKVFPLSQYQEALAYAAEPGRYRCTVSLKDED